MQHDVTLGSITSRHLAFFDPASIPSDLVAGKHPSASEPDPPPKRTLEGLAQQGKLLLIHIPEGDCEASVRVIISEDIGDDVRAKAGNVRKGVLAIPSGELLGDGAEFIRPTGFVFTESEPTSIRVERGLYAVEMLSMVRWKSANCAREVSDRASRAARLASRILTAYTFLAVAVLWLSLFAFPLSALLGWRMAGFKGIAKGLLLVLVVDAVLVTSFWVLERMREHLPILSEVHDLAEQFESQNPDVVVALTPVSEAPELGVSALTLRT